MLKVQWSTIFFLILVFWNMSFLCLFLMRSFVVQVFFVFQDIVWLVKSFWCVHCCSIHQLNWVGCRCRSEFALWWFFVRKSCRHSTGSFSFFLVLTTRHSLSVRTFERQRCFFGVDNALFYFLLVPGSAYFLISVFSNNNSLVVQSDLCRNVNF